MTISSENVTEDLRREQVDDLDKSEFVLEQVEFHAKATMSQIFLQIDMTKEENQQWFLDFEDTDLHTCDRAALLSLLVGVPGKFLLLRGFVAGHLMMRMAMGGVTGREFR